MFHLAKAKGINSTTRKTHRFIAAILAAVLLLACAACSNDAGGGDGSSNTPNASSTKNPGSLESNAPANTAETPKGPDNAAVNNIWLSDLMTDEEMEYNKNAASPDDFVVGHDGFTDSNDYTPVYDIIYTQAERIRTMRLGAYSGDATDVIVPSYCITEDQNYGFGYVDEKGTYHSRDEIGGDFSRITIIGSAFMGNDKITSVTLPNSITWISRGAFKDCVNLSNIAMSDSVTRVEVEAFNNTAWYNNQPDGLVYLGSGLLNSKGEYTAKELTLQTGTTFVADSAFENNKSIEEITLTESCLAIGDNAFSYCTSLTSVDLGDVRRIGYEAFRGCSALETVVIPDSCRYIGTNAFANCDSLSAVYIPKTVKTIGFTNNEIHAFAKSGNVTLYVHDGSQAYKYAKDNGVAFELVDSVPDWAK